MNVFSGISAVHLPLSTQSIGCQPQCLTGVLMACRAWPLPATPLGATAMQAPTTSLWPRLCSPALLCPLWAFHRRRLKRSMETLMCTHPPSGQHLGITLVPETVCMRSCAGRYSSFCQISHSAAETGPSLQEVHSLRRRCVSWRPGSCGSWHSPGVSGSELHLTVNDSRHTTSCAQAPHRPCVASLLQHLTGRRVAGPW